MKVQSYIFFDGRCEEALEFYGSTVGAKVNVILRYKDSPEPQPAEVLPPGSENKIMHSEFSIGETTLMGSDGYCGGKAQFQGFALALLLDTGADAERVFKALSEGGQATMPLSETFFAKRFGMLTDRFGVAWTLLAEPKQ